MDHENMKETELCLGLPGGAATENSSMNKVLSAAGSKRVFAETEKSHEDDFKLKLHAMLPPSSKPPPTPSSKPSPTNGQVVGWPPVRAHRKNAMRNQKNPPPAAAAGGAGVTVPDEAGVGCSLVKVSIDGAPYLRKMELKMYKSYQELSDALAKLCSSFTKGSDGDHDGMIDFMNESKLRDALNCSDHAKTYQDKDGDWMLVGDVPWEMFVTSCRRLRIMKRSEAIGLGNITLNQLKRN